MMSLKMMMWVKESRLAPIPTQRKKYDFLYRKFRKYKLMCIYWKWIGGGYGTAGEVSEEG